jgi:hypothetical protein
VPHLLVCAKCDGHLALVTSSQAHTHDIDRNVPVTGLPFRLLSQAFLYLSDSLFTVLEFDGPHPHPACDVDIWLRILNIQYLFRAYL